jgi:hypothetical protein
MPPSTLAQLEALSRLRPDRVVRLRGRWPLAQSDPVAAQAGAEPEAEPELFELLIFRGFSSSVTHPTAFDPDEPALPAGAVLEHAELLQGPLDPRADRVLAGPLPVEDLLDPQAWL